VGKPEGERPQEREYEVAEDRDQWRALVNTVMELLAPTNFWNFLISCTAGGFSRRAQLHEVSIRVK
jgi:hypothetical protein